jgi:hypothetical protein
MNKILYRLSEGLNEYQEYLSDLKKELKSFSQSLLQNLTEDEKEKLKEGFLKGYLTYENPNIEIPLEVFLKNYEIPICVKVEDFRRRGK